MKQTGDFRHWNFDPAPNACPLLPTHRQEPSFPLEISEENLKGK